MNMLRVEGDDTEASQLFLKLLRERGIIDEEGNVLPDEPHDERKSGV